MASRQEGNRLSALNRFGAQVAIASRRAVRRWLLGAQEASQDGDRFSARRFSALDGESRGRRSMRRSCCHDLPQRRTILWHFDRF
jgi:hypothetical protein